MTEADPFLQYRDMPGIYAFFGPSLGRCWYVGKAFCVYTRVKGHRDRFDGYGAFRVFPMTEHLAGLDHRNVTFVMSAMEAFFIARWCPTENRQRPPLERFLQQVPRGCHPGHRVVSALTGYDEVIRQLAARVAPARADLATRAA